MASDLHMPPNVGPDRTAAGTAEPTMAAMLRGVIDDALELIRQQFAMLKAEVRADFHKLLAGLIPLACAIAPMLLGGLMACFALVHLIHWATLPSGQTTDLATIPLWCCYAIVGAAFLLLGGALLGIGYYRLKTLNPLPEQTAQALEENIQWLMNKHPK